MKKQILKLMTAAFLLMLIVTACKKDVIVTGVTLNELTLTLKVGTSKTLIATVQPTDATNQVITWESSNPVVASVLGNGLVTALSPGEATVIVRTEDGNKTASCVVKVKMPDPPVTKEDLLTQEKGWELYTATSNPAYTNSIGITSENLVVSFFYACELDDILYFNKNKSSILNFGKLICDDQIGKEVSLGNWKFQGEEVLEFHLPYFFDCDDNFALIEAKVVVLDENTLRLEVPLTFSDGGKAAKRGLISTGAKATENYVFTFTYKKVNK
jgi:hypothetical protein